MSKEISPVAYLPSKNLYAVIFDALFQAWNVGGAALEAYNPSATSDQDDYDITLAESGSGGVHTGIYSGDMPADIPDGIYHIFVYERAGSDPDTTDGPPIWGMSGSWDGSAWVPLRPMPVIFGVVDDGSPTSSGFAGDSSLSSSDDFYNGCALVFRSGTLNGITRKVSDYTGLTNTFAFTIAFPTAPADTDKFEILGRIE